MRIRLSVLMPVFNEERELQACLDRVLAAPVADEVIAVDDCSTDGTAKILSACSDPRLKVIAHDCNRGKGAGIRTALEHASGDLVVIQDADTEYDPCDYARLVEPILGGRATVVYGVRDLSTQPLIGHLGNRFLTEVTGLLGGTRLADMETCYKVMPRALLRDLALKSRGFEVEPEITIKLLKRGIRIHEVPISYSPRPDKKLRRFRDGFRSLWALLRFRFQD